jgi:hypothetical protein
MRALRCWHRLHRHRKQPDSCNGGRIRPSYGATTTFARLQQPKTPQRRSSDTGRVSPCHRLRACDPSEIRTDYGLSTPTTLAPLKYIHTHEKCRTGCCRQMRLSGTRLVSVHRRTVARVFEDPMVALRLHGRAGVISNSDEYHEVGDRVHTADSVKTSRMW